MIMTEMSLAVKHCEEKVACQKIFFLLFQRTKSFNSQNTKATYMKISTKKKIWMQKLLGHIEYISYY